MMNALSSPEIRGSARFSWPRAAPPPRARTKRMSAGPATDEKQAEREVTLQVQNANPPADVSVQAFYLTYMVHTARAIQRAILQRISKSGAVPKVRMVRSDPSQDADSLWADILCQTLDSYTHLVHQYANGQLKRKLEGELKKFDYREKLNLILLGHEHITVREGTDTPLSPASVSGSSSSGYETPLTETGLAEKTSLREKVAEEKRNFEKTKEMKVEDDLDLAFQFLKNRVGRNWREFLRVLGASEPEIRNLWLIHFNVRGWHDCIYHGLLIWRRREKDGASLEKLVNALTHISVMRKDVADELQVYWEELKSCRNQSTPSPACDDISPVDLGTVMSLRQQDLVKERERMLALLEGGRVLKQQKRKAKRDFFGLIGSESSAFSRVEKQDAGEMTAEMKEHERSSPERKRDRMAKSESWPKERWVADWVCADTDLTLKANDIDDTVSPRSTRDNPRDHSLARKLDFTASDTPPAAKTEKVQQNPENPACAGNDVITTSCQGTPSSKSIGQISSKSSGFYGSNGVAAEPDWTPSNFGVVISAASPDDGYFTFPSSKNNVTNSTASSTPAVPNPELNIPRDNESVDDGSYHTACSASPMNVTPRTTPKVTRPAAKSSGRGSTLDPPPHTNRWSNSTTTNEELHWEDFQNLSLKDYRLSRGFVTPKTADSSAASERGTVSLEDMDWQHFDNSTPTYCTNKGIRHFTPIIAKSTASSVDSSKFNAINEIPEDNAPEKDDQISEESGDYVMADSFLETDAANGERPAGTPKSGDVDCTALLNGKCADDNRTSADTNAEILPTSSVPADTGQTTKPVKSDKKKKKKDIKRAKWVADRDISIDDLVEPIDDYQDTDGAEPDKPRRKRYTKKSPTKKNSPVKKVKSPSKPVVQLKPKHGGDKKSPRKERQAKVSTDDKAVSEPVMADETKPGYKESSGSLTNSQMTSSPEVTRCIMCPLPTFRKAQVKPTEHKGYKPPPSPWELRRNGSSEEEISRILADADKANGVVGDGKKSPGKNSTASGEVKKFMETFPRFHRSSRGSSVKTEECNSRYSPWEMRHGGSETSRSGAHLVARSASLLNGSITPSFADDVFDSPWIEMDELEMEKQRLLNGSSGLFDDLRQNGLLDLQSDEVDDETCFLLLVGDAVRKLLEENNQDQKNIYALKQLSDSLCEVNLHKKSKNSKPGKLAQRRFGRRRRSDEEVLANVKHTLYGNYTLKFELRRNKKSKKQVNDKKSGRKQNPAKPPRSGGKIPRDSPS